MKPSTQYTFTQKPVQCTLDILEACYAAVKYIQEDPGRDRESSTITHLKKRLCVEQLHGHICFHSS